MEIKNKFLILNSIILILILTLFSFIFVNGAYTSLTGQSGRLSPGNEYRFNRFTSPSSGYDHITRIIYSSSATYDLFLPYKTRAEWDAFYTFKPSTITFTYPTCEMVGNQEYWTASQIYGCTEEGQKCWGGVCRTSCNGYLEGNYRCIHYTGGRQGYSCDENCASYGGCHSNMPSGIDGDYCNYFGKDRAGGDNTGKAPAMIKNTWGTWECKYRYQVDASCSEKNGNYNRFCWCNY